MGEGHSYIWQQAETSCYAVTQTDGKRSLQCWGQKEERKLKEKINEENVDT